MRFFIKIFKDPGQASRIKILARIFKDLAKLLKNLSGSSKFLLSSYEIFERFSGFFGQDLGKKFKALGKNVILKITM